VTRRLHRWRTPRPISSIQVPSEVAELYCREQFVVDRYEVIGHDDDFLGG